MDNLVFLVKSHAPHLDYTKQLIETTAKHNKDNIPIYLSIPKSQENIFKDNIDTTLCNIIFDEDIIKGDLSDEFWENGIHEGIEEIFILCKKLKGTISGEHGIGLVQKRYMHLVQGETQLELQRGIKKVFDPNGILNPGKIF